jgi:glucan biosynthesis protein C
MKERRYDIDWLRVIAMLSVFIFHSTRFFCTTDWHIKVPVDQQSDVLGIVRAFLFNAWFMELFCLVSGFAAWYALKKRTGGQFLVERVKRLLIPLYTVGMFILVVPQDYFQNYTHGETTATFWQWLPSYYRELPGRVLNLAGHNYADPVNLLPYSFSGHLWFIQMLFIISVLTLPILLYLKSEPGKRLIDRLAGWTSRPGGIFLFLIPLAIIRIGFRWLPLDTDRTWADFLWYACYFVIGYILAADERFTASIKRSGWIGLTMWIVFFWVIGALFTFVLGFETDSGQGIWYLYVLWQINCSIFSWGSVVFMLSLGAKYLNLTNGLLTYANEAVLPFFLFHQTIILIVGWYIIPLAIGNIAKFLIIVLISFPVIMILYEVFVRHIGFMRFLFGMLPQPKKQPGPTTG